MATTHDILNDVWDSVNSLLSTGFPSGSQIADAGPGWTTARTRTTSADISAGTDLTAAPTSGQKLVITDVIVSTDTTMKLTFTEETSGTVLFAIYISASAPAQITPRGKLKLPVADKKLRCTASVAGNVDITVLYYSEA